MKIFENTYYIKSRLAIMPLAFMCLLSCDKDDEFLKLQSHDDNEFMTIMHNMNSQMDAMQMTGDADHDFVSMMVIHHQGAIDMANKELMNGNDPTIRAMAQQIIDMQTAEKTELTTWLENHTPDSNTEGQAFANEIMNVMEKMKNWKDIQLLTGDADNDFAQLMIVHHQNAFDNAQSILHHGHHDEIKEMANKMIEDQNQEITDLAAWLKINGPYRQ